MGCLQDEKKASFPVNLGAMGTIVSFVEFSVEWRSYNQNGEENGQWTQVIHVVFTGDDKLPSDMGMKMNHFKDPYEPTSIMKCYKGFVAAASVRFTWRPREVWLREQNLFNYTPEN